MNTAEVKDYGRIYSDLWGRYKTQIAAHQAACNQIAADERDGTGGAVFYVGDDYLENVMQNTAVDIFKQLIFHAKIAFAPTPQDVLAIEEGEFLKHYIHPLEISGHWERFDPTEVWASLCARYGDGAGNEITYRQYAAKLRTFFYVRRGDPVKVVTGRVVLDRSVYLDPYDKASGKTVLGHNSREIMENGLSALASFCRWGDDNATAEGIKTYMENIQNARGAITSRERITISPNLEVVTYHTRFEFRFTKELADKFQLFMASYADLKENAA